MEAGASLIGTARGPSRSGDPPAAQRHPPACAARAWPSSPRSSGMTATRPSSRTAGARPAIFISSASASPLSPGLRKATELARPSAGSPADCRGAGRPCVSRGPIFGAGRRPRPLPRRHDRPAAAATARRLAVHTCAAAMPPRSRRSWPNSESTPRPPSTRPCCNSWGSCRSRARSSSAMPCLLHRDVCSSYVHSTAEWRRPPGAGQPADARPADIRGRLRRFRAPASVPPERRCVEAEVERATRGLTSEHGRAREAVESRLSGSSTRRGPPGLGLARTARAYRLTRSAGRLRCEASRDRTGPGSRARRAQRLRPTRCRA